ncbi:MAG: hypothetical protein J0H55_08555 [Chitinophagaceae bacterium]|nr:hypothetical protein [Chitinophagaceae bacterium]
MTSKSYSTLEEFTISDWVNRIAEDTAEYLTPRTRRKMKSDYFGSKK